LQYANVKRQRICNVYNAVPPFHSMYVRMNCNVHLCTLPYSGMIGTISNLFRIEICFSVLSKKMCAYVFLSNVKLYHLFTHCVPTSTIKKTIISLNYLVMAGNS